MCVVLTGLRYWTALSQCRQAALLLIDKKQGPSDYKRGCNPQEKEKLSKADPEILKGSSWSGI